MLYFRKAGSSRTSNMTRQDQDRPGQNRREKRRIQSRGLNSRTCVLVIINNVYVFQNLDPDSGYTRPKAWRPTDWQSSPSFQNIVLSYFFPQHYTPIFDILFLYWPIWDCTLTQIQDLADKSIHKCCHLGFWVPPLPLLWIGINLKFRFQ